ncbi:DNA-formamidopyrimidine glycosylase [Fulvivirga maritima]|uniref:Fpg/Nei family DNA glycosylase n=1 Tax=Fulvivirga maritima TaxID=2904247 RepID=UPI001F168768|nr:DNA-formamidopyrimidine glycosylase family protein [Fulvivirga maritima]UII28175.1 DNA-formamidopyrimidine glycosylase [Fulvivirga maritima]
MPELPEVEMYRRYAESTVLHKKVIKTEVTDTKLLKVSIPTFKKHIEGQSFSAITRVGKYIFIKTTGAKYIVVHFGMTGNWQYFKDEEDIPKYSKVLFYFDNGFKLSYISKRKFGWLNLTDSIEKFQQDNNLGPDALDTSMEAFIKSLEGRKAPIKSFLLNQKTMSGIGNWMADDILYQSKMHPETPINHLTSDDKKIIYEKIQHVCKVAIEKDAHYDDFPPYFLIHNRKKGGKCYHTGDELEKITVGGRGTFISPKWQIKK